MPAGFTSSHRDPVIRKPGRAPEPAQVPPFLCCGVVWAGDARLCRRCGRVPGENETLPPEAERTQQPKHKEGKTR